MNPVGRYHNIPRLEFGIHGTRDSGKDDRIKLEMVDCHLGRQRRIDHAHTRQKKIEMLAVKIDQSNAGSVYFLDFVSGVLWDDRFLDRLQFRLERRNDADPLQLCREANFGPEETVKK
jgi:hypothetical protein